MLTIVSFLFSFNFKIIPNYRSRCVSVRFSERIIAIWYTSYHFQNLGIPTPLRYENHSKKNMFQWKQKAYPIWKLEWSHSDLVWWKHSVNKNRPWHDGLAIARTCTVTRVNQEKGDLGGWWKACPKVKLCGLISPMPNAK